MRSKASPPQAVVSEVFSSVVSRRSWTGAFVVAAILAAGCGTSFTSASADGGPQADAGTSASASGGGSASSRTSHSTSITASHGASSGASTPSTGASSTSPGASSTSPGATSTSPSSTTTSLSVSSTASSTSTSSGGTSSSSRTSTTSAPGAIDLGTAADYVILAETGISTVSPSAITGDLGVSPAAATYITGFSPTLAGSGRYSTSAQVVGRIYAADYADPTPSNLSTAIQDMDTAFTAAAGRAPDVTGLGAGSIGGRTLPPGVYGWSTGLLLATDVTLSGHATDVWIFQIAQGLTVSDGVHLVLAGGAQAKNVFWQVSGSVTLGTTVEFEGTILCQTAIALDTGASITGRLLAQTAATLDANTVVAAP